MNCECNESFMVLPDVHLLLSTADFSLEEDINQNTNDHEIFLSESEDYNWIYLKQSLPYLKEVAHFTSIYSISFNSLN